MLGYTAGRPGSRRAPKYSIFRRQAAALPFDWRRILLAHAGDAVHHYEQLDPARLIATQPPALFSGYSYCGPAQQVSAAAEYGAQLQILRRDERKPVNRIILALKSPGTWRISAKVRLVGRNKCQSNLLRRERMLAAAEVLPDHVVAEKND